MKPLTLTLSLSAALFLQTVHGQTTSSYTVPVLAGQAVLIANQLDHGSNTLNEVFTNVPDGSSFYKFDNTSGWVVSAYSVSNGWLNGSTITLAPGEGAFLRSPANFTLSFQGQPHVPVLPVSLSPGRASLLSRQTNDLGMFETIVGTNAAAGTRVFKWNPATQSYDIFTSIAFGSGWTPAAPVAAVGEAIWISPLGSPDPPLPPNSYTLTLRAGFTAIANQLDHGSNTVSEVLTNLPDGCVLYKFNNASSTWQTAMFNGSAGVWTPGDIILNPGEGAFLESPVPWQTVMYGHPHVPVLPVSIPPGVMFLLSRQTNDVGTYESITGTAPPAGAVVYRFNGSGYDSFVYNGDWSPTAPVVPVGESLWFAPSGSNTVVVGFPQVSCGTNKIVQCGTAWTFDPPGLLGGACGSNATVTVLNTVTNGSPCPAVLTRTWLVTDHCGNRVTCSQTVLAEGCTCPQPANSLVLNYPNSITALVCDGCATVDYNVTAGNSSCCNVEVTTFPPSGSVFPLGTTTVYILGTDGCGGSNSASFNVTVLPDPACCQPPMILQPPIETIVSEGSDATLTVAAAGTGPLAYQWFFQGTALPGQVSPSLLLPSVSMTNTGAYNVVIGGPCGSVTSQVAVLLVPPAPSSDLALRLDAPGAIVIGSTATYNFTVTNQGDASASGVVLTSRWDVANASLVGSSSGCVFTPNGTLLDMSCAIGDLPAGASLSFQVVLQGSSPGTIPFAAGVTGTPGDPNLVDNFASGTTGVGYAPVILQDPTDFSTTPGAAGSLNVYANSPSRLGYQWRFRGAEIANATDSALPLAEVHGSDAGPYDVVVSTPFASVTSRVATVSLTFPPQITAGVDGGRALRITGSSGTDDIEVRLQGGNPTQLEVVQNSNGGQVLAFDTAGFDRLVVELGDGNNKLVVNDANGLVVGLSSTLEIYSGVGSNLVVASSAGLNLADLPALVSALQARPDLAGMAQTLFDQSYDALMTGSVDMAKQAYTNLVMVSQSLTNQARSGILACASNLFTQATLLANTASNYANEAHCRYGNTNALLQYAGSAFTNCILGRLALLDSLVPSDDTVDVADPQQAIADQLGDQLDQLGQSHSMTGDFLEDKMTTLLGGDDFYNRVNAAVEQPGIQLGEVDGPNCEIGATNFEALASQQLEVPAAALEAQADAMTSLATNFEAIAAGIEAQAQAIEQLVDTFTAGADPAQGWVAVQAYAAGLKTGTNAGCDRDINPNNKVVIHAGGLIIGTPLADRITATTQASIILGLGGDDLIIGSDGPDLIFGGSGNDEIHGLQGDDLLFGGAGDDCIFGDEGIDVIFGGIGNDNLHGGTNFDLIIGGPGNDKLFGDENTDVLIGGDGDDEMHGGDGIDLMFGGAGKDTMYGDGGETFTNLSNCSITIGNLMIGGADDDIMYGSDGIDVMFGGDGNDTIFGSNQVDIIFGNAGDDKLYGGDGGALFKINIDGVDIGIRMGNLIFGGDGNDTIEGGRDIDLLFGGAGDDNIKGSYDYPWWQYPKLGFECGDIEIGLDDDLIFGGPGNDTLDGGYGTDFIFGGPGNDIIKGNGQPFRTIFGEMDFLFGGTGDDVITGGEWDYFNFMFGGPDNDTMTGGKFGIMNLMFASDGNDLMNGNGNLFNLMFGGDGDDVMNGGALLIDLMFGGAGNDTMDGKSGLLDVMFGNGDHDLMYGGGGALNLMFGGDEDDVMYGGPGVNIMFGNDDCDTMYGNNTFDLIFGDDGDDTIHCGNGLEIAFGNDGEDVIFGGNGANILFGNAGNDRLYGGPGFDLIFGGPDNDEIHAYGGPNLLFGGAGNDRISGGQDFDLIFGGLGDDVIDAGDGFNVVFGGAGNDTLIGGSGINVLFGGADNDSITASGSLNLLFGGAGNDVITATTGRSLLLGQGDNDILVASGGDKPWLFGNGGDDELLVDGATRARLLGGSGSNTYEVRSGSKRFVRRASSGTVTVPGLPTLTCPADKTVYAASAWTFDSPTASSPDCGDLSVVVVATATNCGPCGDTLTRLWQTTDCHGRSLLCHQSVTLVNILLTCTTNKTVGFGTAWTFDPPTAVDGTTGSNVTVSVVGTTTNGVCPLLIQQTWQATDACGHSATCSQTVTVIETAPPVVVSTPSNVVVCALNGCGTMPDTTALVGATNHSGSVTVSQNPPAGSLVCSNLVVIYTVSDGCGNATNTVALVTLQPCCYEPPHDMVLWLTFDETNGLTCLNSMGGNPGTRLEGNSWATELNGPTRTYGQYVNNCLCFDGLEDSVQVWDYQGLHFGSSNFSFDAWVKWNGGAGLQTLLDKRANYLGSANQYGYYWYLNGGRPGLELASGAAVDFLGASPLNTNQWTHLAVTVDRQSVTGLRFYRDGVLTDTFDPTSQPGNLDGPLETGSNLYVGASTTTNQFRGCLDEVEMFSRALNAAEVSGLATVQTKGKCRPSCSLPWITTVCGGSVTVTGYIYNNGANSVDYSVSFQRANCGMPGAVTWPANTTPFSPASTVVHVLPHQRAPVTVTIARPPGLVDYSSPSSFSTHTACFEMVFHAVGSPDQFACSGTLRDGSFECAIYNPLLAPNWTNLVFRGTEPGGVTLPVLNTSSTAALIPAQFVVLDDQMQPDTNSISLNGLPPGTAVTTAALLAGQTGTNLSVTASFVRVQPARTYYLVLLAGVGTNGELVPVASATLRNLNPPTVGPLVDIASANGHAIVSWDLVNTDFQLESTAAVAGTNWAPVSATVLEMPNARQGVSLPATNSAQLFRLRQ